jgi:hypothetical protein
VTEESWAIVRIALGTAQVFGATFSAVLLIQTGVSRPALLSVALTCLCTTASVLLFGSRRPKRNR